MATGDQNQPSITTTMKYEIGTCSGYATKKLKILPESVESRSPMAVTGARLDLFEASL